MGQLDGNHHQPQTNDEILERSKANDETESYQQGFKQPTAKVMIMKTVFGILIVISTGASICANSQFATIAYRDYNFTSTSLVNWFAGSAFMINYPMIALCMMCFGHDHQEIYREAMLVCGKDGFTIRGATQRMLTMAVATAMATYSYYYALTFTSSTDVTAVFSSATGFVYVLSLICLKEPFIVLRLLAVILSIGGVVLIAYSEGIGSFEAVGVLLAVASALCSAIFRVLAKKFIPNASLAQAAMLLSMVGFYSMLILWIPTLILHCLGVEVLSASSFPWPFFMIVFFHVLYNLLLCSAIAVTYPIYASLGPVLAIPMNAAIDASIRQEDFNIFKILGTITLIASFLILTIPIPIILAFSAKIQSIVLCRRNH